MIIHVRLFARARDLARTDLIETELAEDATVADLRRRLAADYPELAGLLERSAIAVANDFADDSRVLPANAEVALLPPVSGGQAAHRPAPTSTELVSWDTSVPECQSKSNEIRTIAMAKTLPPSAEVPRRPEH